MWTNIRGNWFCYLIGIAVFLLLIYYVTRWMKQQPLLPEDTIYYQVIDDTGQKSIIHDSGIKPSNRSPGSVFTIQILKNETNNGQDIHIGMPTKILLGHSPKNLSYLLSVNQNNLNEEELYYTLSIEVPVAKNERFPFN